MNENSSSIFRNPEALGLIQRQTDLDRVDIVERKTAEKEALLDQEQDGEELLALFSPDEMRRFRKVENYRRRVQRGEAEALRIAHVDLRDQQTQNKQEILDRMNARRQRREEGSRRRARIIEVVQGAGGKLAEILNKEYKDPPKTF